MRGNTMKIPFGPRGFGQGPRGSRCGPGGRIRRGDIKIHVLRSLKDEPRHGYEIMDALERESGGYRPSPGSIYPTLQMLEEGGFVTGEQVDGKKVYTITDKGREVLEARGKEKFEADAETRAGYQAKQAMMKLGAAVVQGVRESDADASKKIIEVIDKARKDVYLILSDL